MAVLKQFKAKKKVSVPKKEKKCQVRLFPENAPSIFWKV